MSRLRCSPVIAAFGAVLLVSGCATRDGGSSANSEAAATAKPYLYSQCLVIDQPLTFGGGPFTRYHEGREVKFCCKPCIKTFEANPEIWMAKLDRWDRDGGPKSLPGTSQ